MARFLVICGVAFIASIDCATAQTLVERGAYLVNAVMVCDIGHTTSGMSGLIME